MAASDENSPSLDQLVRRFELSGEAVFRRLLETAPDAVVIATPDGRILYANEQAQAMFGYDRHELVGEPVEALIPARLHARHVEHR